MSTPLVQARELEKLYRTDSVETHAVNRVSFSIAAGEYLVLTGPSGCGKSSLLSMLGLMEPPTGGSLLLDGVDIATMSEAERAYQRGMRLGIVFQAFQLIPHLTVRQNIELPLCYHRVIDAQEKKQRAIAAATDVGMAHRLDHYPDQLSGGQQQRVGIARALVGNPRLILADEPTGNLDSENGKQVMQLLAKLHSQGTAVCLVTHDLNWASAGQRTLVMHDGRIIDDVRRAA